MHKSETVSIEFYVCDGKTEKQKQKEKKNQHRINNNDNNNNNNNKNNNIIIYGKVKSFFAVTNAIDYKLL